MKNVTGEDSFDLNTVAQFRTHPNSGPKSSLGNSLTLRKTLCCLALLLLAFTALPIDNASAETRKLKLYFLHTGERAEIAYKKNGKYLSGGLNKINRFLRDWRRNEPTKMDPKLLDLIWEVYTEAGGRKHIHVISGYRSPKTNNLLRKRGRGVAKKSQHTLGKALDFFIPGVKLSKLRAIGLKRGIGGVGYYPKSGSPFVHMDTGRVRHWPRMSRKELVRVFPNGKTLHVPSDGKPLPGYNIAKARYEKATSGRIIVAKAEEIRKKPNFFAKLLGRADEENDSADSATIPKPVATIKTPATIQDIVPAAPEPQAPQSTVNLIAALSPDKVPVPLLAPRTILPIGTALAINTLDPLAETTQEVLAEQQIASAIPIPVQAGRTVAAPIDSIALVAQAEPLLSSQVNTTQVAALSPTEIQDLRRQVGEAIATPVTARTNSNRVVEPFAPPSVQIATATSGIPRPTQGLVGETGNTLFGYATSAPQQTAQTAISNQIAVASAETVEQAFIATPTISPIRLTTLSPEVTKPKVNLVEEASIKVAGIPIPIRNPSRAIVPVQTAQTETASRVLSIEQFESANLSERLTGKWALASDARIADIADIRPPAYGHNIIRERPNTVLSSGFSRDRINDFTKGFSGSSVEFLNFKRFE